MSKKQFKDIDDDIIYVDFYGARYIPTVTVGIKNEGMEEACSYLEPKTARKIGLHLIKLAARLEAEQAVQHG